WLGQTRQLRHLDAVRSVGGAGFHLVQKHDLVAPLAHVHGDVGDLGQAACKGRQLVIVRGEQGAAGVDLVQVLHHRPGDRETVEGGGAAADLVEDDERAAGGLVEN